MSGYDEVDHIEISSTQKFDDVIMETERRIKECRHHKIPLDDREFMQFKKSWFYHNWYHRFKRLGNVGVISIPNTTLEEWIYWLYEWSVKFTDDYNKFKKLVWEALKLHEEHLTILDNKIADLEARVEDIERQLLEIWQKINQILGDINEMQEEIERLKEKDRDLQEQIDAFKANVFNVSYPNKQLGTLKNGWALKHESPQEDFALMWGWNNPNDHSQGIHYTPILNYIYKTGVFNATMIGDTLVGSITVPQEIKDAGFYMGETWIYAGFVAQSNMLAGNVFVHLVPNGDEIDVKLLNTVHTGWNDLLESMEWQLNTGGAVPQYLT